MGYKLVKFSVTPDENEQIHAVVKVPKESRSVIHGIVIDECNKPLKDAVVKLLKESKHDPKRLEAITHTFTDEHGQFLFGPLCPHVKYVIKVWVNHVKIRDLVIKPEPCEDDCIDETKPHKLPSRIVRQEDEHHYNDDDDYE